MITPRRKLTVLADEPDNRILECAVAGNSDVIVTGDRAFLKLEQFQDIRILTLRQFVDEVAAHGTSKSRTR